MKDLVTRAKEHDKLLQKWSSRYKEAFNDSCEFTFDGPSDWFQYSQRHPKVLVLLKESQGDGWHPRQKCIMGRTRFSQNVTLWKYAIKTLYQNPATSTEFPGLLSIHNGDHSDIAFVEVKKLNQDNSTSDDNEIRTYATNDKELLKAQIALLDPHIVLCAGTIDSYDAIYDENYDPYIELSSNENCKCWQLCNRLVIDFVHPSYPGASPELLYHRLCSIITEGNVFKHFNW
jgi:hypothetical protein